MDSKNKIRLLDIKTSRLVNDIFVWNYKAKFKWHWIEFADIREYEHWDDIKHIDWQATAKHNKAYVRKYEEERQLKLMFLINISESMNFWIWNKLKIDTLIEVLSILSFSAEKNWDLVWAFIYNKNWVSKYFPPKKWKVNVLAILKYLLNDIFNNKKVISNTWKTSIWINDAMLFLKKHKVRNFLIFGLTDEVDNLDDKFLRLTWISNDFIYINIFDEFENKLNYKWVFNFIQNWNSIEVNTWNEKLRKKYVDYRNEKIWSLSKRLWKYRIKYLLIDNKTNIFKYLLKFFKKKG